jgi:hypothetical protein
MPEIRSALSILRLGHWVSNYLNQLIDVISSKFIYCHI